MQKYFVRSKDREGTCYYEFYKGRWNGKTFWHDESICISDEAFAGSALEKMIAEVIPQYDPWGETAVSKSNWELIKNKAIEQGGKSAAIVNEAEDWMEENFHEHDLFTILGM